ncbi:MAG: hypothetical protein NPINA01_33490 [Nitrospinaceae bacterium]|nr:MAG: hypothetical protein NPINA01_33490 [Nitrospinaceae bacterium]
MDTDGDGTIDTTIDLTEDGKGNLPQGTPFDSDGDGTNDSVIGHDGKAYPDENEDGQPDPGKPPIVDPSQTSNNQDPLCQDDPTTTANECAPGGPANCVENPNTPEKECTDGGGYCVDDPNTLIDECAPDSDDCIDDPNTIEDECGPGHDGDCVEDPTTPELECPAPGSGECIDDPETEEDECGSGKQSVGLSGCQEAPACEGSVFDCALIQLQWETTCTFTIDDNARNSDESLFAPKEEDDGSKLWQDITEIEGFPDFPDPGTASSTAVCPPPLVISTPLGNFSFDISPICPLFNLAGTIILIACSLVGVRALATQIG